MGLKRLNILFSSGELPLKEEALRIYRELHAFGSDLFSMLPFSKEVKILVGFSFFFLMLSVVIFSFTLIVRFHNSLKEKIASKRRRKYHDYLSDYLLEKEDISKALLKIKRRRRKQFLINEIVSLYRNLEGSIAGKLATAFYSLKLFELSMQKLRSNNTSLMIDGLREIGEMQIQTAGPEIRKCLQHKQPIIREEAVMALSRLDYPVKLDFLRDYDSPLNLWLQIRLQNVFQKYPNKEYLPDFSELLKSSNISIIAFGLRMIKFYRQFECHEEVHPFLHHRNHMIRRLAIEAIGAISNGSAVELLTCQYYQETKRNQIHILQAIRQHSKKLFFKPIKEVLKHEQNFDILFHAAYALYLSGKDGKKTVKKVLKKQRPEFKGIYKHVKNIGGLR